MRFYLICIFCFPIFVWSQEQHAYKHAKDIHPVGEANGMVYLLSTEKKEWEMEVYAETDFRLIRKISLGARKDKRVRVLEAVLVLDSLPTYVTSYADMSQNERVVELFRVLGDSVLPAVRLGTLSMKSIPGDPSASRALEVEWCIAPNEQFVAFSLQNQDDMSTAANRLVTVYDHRMQEYSKTKMVVSSPQNLSHVEYRLEDQLRLLNSGLLVQKTIVKVYFFGSGSVFSVELPELSDNYDVCELFNGTIVICGLSINREGGFVQSVNARDRGRVIATTFDYKDSGFFRLRKVIPQADGAILLVAEEIIYDKSTGYSRTYRTANGNTVVRRSPTRTHIETGVTRFTYKAVLGKEIWSEEFESSADVSGKEKGLCLHTNNVPLLVYGNFAQDSSVVAASRIIASNGHQKVRLLFPEGPGIRVLPESCVPLNRGCVLFTREFFTYRRVNSSE